MTTKTTKLAILAAASVVVAFAQSTNQPGNVPYEPITAKQRAEWAVQATVGPRNLLAGVFVAGLGTLNGKPDEYNSHWEGFGQRYGLRLTGNATSNLIEAGVGSLWGEDPRYYRAAGQPFKHRVGHVFKMVIYAHDRDGQETLAYARFIANPASNVISNAWRPDSQTTASATIGRVGYGFLGKLVANSFSEFWPDIKGRITHENR